MPEDLLARLPDSLPLKTAGGIPLVGLTAWQALHEGDPKPGKRVLVHAACGGVGHMAVQIAKALGMYVVSMCIAGSQVYCPHFVPDGNGISAWHTTNHCGREIYAGSRVAAADCS